MDRHTGPGQVSQQVTEGEGHPWGPQEQECGGGLGPCVPTHWEYSTELVPAPRELREGQGRADPSQGRPQHGPQPWVRGRET